MALSSGSKLGPYEILTSIGAGGMGEVYRAKDPRVGRDVAIKVSNEQFSDRFAREARAVASLNHSNIATLYDVGPNFLVMELVEGQTLAERTSQGAIPLEEALEIARQIADALEAAHEKGIVHRDLKPGNIKIRLDGTVKVLDFGLAKVAETTAASTENSPTVSALQTQAGVILGTAAYMSPEQAKGKPVDKRADIWALGCILYECLTGKRAFAGETITDTLAAILRAEPDWDALPATTPAHVRFALRRCLEKNLDGRLHDAADVRIALEEQRGSPQIIGAASKRPWLDWSFKLFLILALGIALWAPWRTALRPQEVTRSFLDVAPADYLQSNPADQTASQGHLSRTSIALTPDGRTVVFSAARGGMQQLYARKLDRLEAFPIAGTEGGNSPFISPDGMWVGFWAADALKKVSLAGEGLPTVICQSASIFGASWGTNDVIVFSRGSGGLWQVPASGGTPKLITEPDSGRGEVSHRLPQLLPGNASVIFTIARSILPTWDDTEIVVQSLATNERKTLIEGGADGRYVSTGHLLYVRRGVLMAVPVDLKTLTARGGSVVLINNLMQSANMMSTAYDSGAGQFAVSEGGSFAYVQGTIYQFPERSLVWVDRTGNIERLAGEPRPYIYPRLSSDGKRILVATQGDRNIWLYDVLRGNATRLTEDGRSMAPAWTPDGKRAIYGTSTTGTENLFWKPVDGSGSAERLTEAKTYQRASFVSSDGEALFFIQGGDIWSLSLKGDHKALPVMKTPFNEKDPDLSPDRKWLAYASDESGRYEVYVRQYPGLGSKLLISTEGGLGPSWRKDGRELFYLAPASSTESAQYRMMAITVNTVPSFSAGKPQMLFQVGFASTPNVRGYDVTPDGKRFLMVQQKERPPIKPSRIVLVQNWLEELKHGIPIGKNE